MPLTHNGVSMREALLVSPELSVAPAAESRLSMSGYFLWDDLVSQAASKAFLGWARVALAYRDDAADPPFVSPNPDFPYLNYTNPLAHPDWPNQMFLAERFDSVRGHVPNSPSAGPNQTATFDEGLTAVGFKSPMNGYRVLPDSAVVADPAHVGVPREYFCLRNMEVVEQQTSKAQSIPANEGLRWVTTAGPADVNVSSANFLTLHEGEITLDWYPVPVAGYNEAAFLGLIGKTNSANFPPDPPNPAGAPPPRSFLTTKFTGTLVMGQPVKRIVRMGDTNWAYRVTLRLKWFPYGANAFFWWNPPAAARGRVRIGPSGAPVADGTLGGPGYYPVQRPDGSKLFPPGPYAAAFVPPGTPANGIPGF